MPSPRQRLSAAVATTTACAVGMTLAAAPAAHATLDHATPAARTATAVVPTDTPGPASAWPLMVTEIGPNPGSHDEYEFFEVHNTTGEDVRLGDGYTFAYTYVDSDDRARDVPLTVSEDVTVPAGGTVVLWLSYATDDFDSFSRTVEDFRAAWGMTADVPVVRVTGQGGMANGGNRGIRVLHGQDVVSWSFYPGGSAAIDRTAHFRIPGDVADRGLELLAGPAAPTPGVVADEAFVAPTPEPEPDFDPQPDPALRTSRLQVTEVLPDSTNVGSADGYEFIELYNATSEPVGLDDYTVNYLYPNNRSVTENGNEVRWPAAQRDVVVQPGATVVVWVKNGQNDELTDADFNAQFGTDLTMGTDLVETFVGGMANGSPRGLEIMTNSGFSVNRAYYNMVEGQDDTQPDQGIRYAVDPADPALQTMLGIAPATPGTVQAEQVPDGLMVEPADTVAPQVEDLTPSPIDPAQDFTIEVRATDDVQVRTLDLTLSNDVDAEARTVTLEHQGDDLYRYSIHAADLTGKAWYEYTLTARDGSNVTQTEPRRVPVDGVDTAPVRLGLDEGQFVTGTTPVIASGDTYPSTLELAVDGERQETTPSIEAEPVFVVEATGIDNHFKNGILVGDDVLRILDVGVYSGWETFSQPVPPRHVRQGEELVVSVWAGTKAAPEIDPDENNDDFTIRALRLVLPDGRTLTPVGYDDPGQSLSMGDSAGKHEFYDARFQLPEDAFTSVATDWDTTTHADGPVTVTATDGTSTAERTVVVDNTGPQVRSGIVDGTPYQGEIRIEPEITDAGSGVAEVVATLDGAEIALPHTTSSLELAPGEHVLRVEARDVVGNVAEHEVTFTTYDEYPSAGEVSPADGATVGAGDVTLQAQVNDPTGDVLDVQFLEGDRLDLADGEVALRSGTTHDALALDREQPEALSTDQVAALATTDGVATEVSSDAELPYQLFDVEVPQASEPGTQVRVTWTGRANPGAQVRMYALAADGSAWSELERFTATDAEEPVTLEAFVDVAAHAADGAVRVLVQHSEGWAGENLSDRTTPVTPHHPDDVARSEYDFTFGWESDTQYYNEEFHEHQTAIHDYLLDRREELNLQYVFHTGDIVDVYDDMAQWENADPEYAKFDDAGLPYGVLAGNHDVGDHTMDYSNYSAYFGEDRFAGNPWYGESYQDNRGHYDLVTAGGIDFLMVYVGWGPADAEIAWMNEVLAQYPDRVAIINQHEFILTTGGLGEIPQRILDEVVAKNPNVEMVFSGHYHDAYTRVDSFDDDGDGVDDRTVHSMLFDYQGLPEGGQGYLRLLHFDNEGERMMVRTYSPSLDRYNSDDPGLLAPGEDPYADQSFEVSYADLGIAPVTKTLATDAFSAEILTAAEIASFEDVASGSVLTATWTVTEPGEHGWYVRSTDPHGAVDLSTVRELTVVAAGPGTDPGTDPGADPGTDPGTGPGGDGGPGDGGGAGDPAPGGEPSGPGDGGDAGGSDDDRDRDRADRRGAGGLATTGASAAGLAAAGGALAVGGVLLLVARRRWRARHGVNASSSW
ncbi:lamin tail domain-containing protein [Cellulosimicrobium cellulans]|uniref:lamin tail domain-containing protein n=1 Tax=Cellulosimicrobium cellulans TaxID=1710 RepID=UPI000848B5A6|nr:lamin tail domain-containing protein [Cellulosimicrobium cellulans]